MSLEQWHNNGWVHLAERSPQEVAALLAIAARELADGALTGMSADGRFDHAYAAVRALSQAALRANGYAVPKGGREHERVIESLKFTLGGSWNEEADYFDRCRRRRHQSMYEASGVCGVADAEDLLERAKKLQHAIIVWLKNAHADLMRD